jgi:hypothetical protein
MVDNPLNAKLFIATVKVGSDYSKSLRLEMEPGPQIYVITKTLEKGYEEYILPIINYYDKDVRDLERRLGVVSIVSMGPYIRGLFGGEGKKGKEKYAGLIVEKSLSQPEWDIYRIKLSNTSSEIEVSKTEYEKQLYSLIYRGITHPFYSDNPYTIFGSRDKRSLVSSLKHMLSVNGHMLGRGDREKMEKLIDEVQYPARLNTFKKGKWYTLFRINRTFSSFVLTPPDEKWITESHMAYIDCGTESNKAYYYAAVLNYLAYKVTKLGLSFVRDQFSRPILAILDAGLSWNQVRPEIQNDISELSIILHREMKDIFRDTKLNQEKKAFMLLEKNENFNYLIKKLDGETSKDKILGALAWVAGKTDKKKKGSRHKATSNDNAQKTLRGL